MKKQPVIAGNWKMHHAPSDARRFFRAFRPSWPGVQPDILVFPSAISFAAALDALPGRPVVQLGVQNIHPEPRGAFTGELSAPMARAAGASHALVGHSERRHLFGESDQDAAAKARAAADAGLVPVVCVGETLQERRAGQAGEVIVRQLDAALAVLTPADDVMVAYEPVWAIGTGETATPSDASSAHGILRCRLVREWGGESATAVRILYGGSVNPGNAAQLLASAEIDGVLVGGASLDPDSFARIALAGQAGSA